MPEPPQAGRRPATLWQTAMVVLFATLAFVLHVTSILGEEATATKFMSLGLWQRVAALLGGRFTETITPEGGLLRQARFDLVPLAVPVLLLGLAIWLLGGVAIARCRAVAWRAALVIWGPRAWVWLFLAAAWEFLDMVALLIAPGGGFEQLLVGTLPFWHAAMLSGFATTFFALAGRPLEGLSPLGVSQTGQEARGLPLRVWAAAACYLLCMGTLNTGLYQALLLPHGDSAMYEEHLWNLAHGKGFRSFLDDGRLFLGEHIQVVHLLFLPAHLLWPSQLTLEWIQSALLAAGAFPVYGIALRQAGSSRAAAAMALAYLAYLPMQFLDISIDFKTFRPNSFEIPLLLFALDALECGRLRMFCCWSALALGCQEDAAVVLAPLGVWMALSRGCLSGAGQSLAATPAKVGTAPRALNPKWLGWGMAIFCAAYVAVVIKVVLPWFRNGADVHFARYFAGLGEDTNSIVGTILAHPGAVWARLWRAECGLFLVSLLAPLGFLPVLAPARLLIAAPLFAVLCLSEITDSPLHHFHAPIVPILVWSACHGLRSVPRAAQWLASARARWRRHSNADIATNRHIPANRFLPSGKSLPSHLAPNPAHSARQAEPQVAGLARRVAAFWALVNGLAVGLFLSIGPLGIAFWDPDSMAWWREKYLPGERARRFARVFEAIPIASRVASTDYLHTRFTHHERSYDYSGYRPRVPDDADYLVIDARGPGSRETKPDEVAEFRARPERWQIVTDLTDDYFIVFKRR
jgi:uncharacterized membrane protein